MFSYIQEYGLNVFVKKEAIYLVTSIALAETFYKFHSFLLESVAFLITWYLLSWLGDKLGFKNDIGR